MSIHGHALELRWTAPRRIGAEDTQPWRFRTSRERYGEGPTNASCGTRAPGILLARVRALCVPYGNTTVVNGGHRLCMVEPGKVGVFLYQGVGVHGVIQ